VIRFITHAQIVSWNWLSLLIQFNRMNLETYNTFLNFQQLQWRGDISMISWHSSRKAFAHINYKTSTRNELNVMGTKIDLDSYKLHYSLNHHGKHYIPFSKKIYIKMIEFSRLTIFFLKLGKFCVPTLWNLITLF